MTKKIGLLHPGQMGVSLAASAIQSGHEVYWCSQGRSAATRKRAQEIGMKALESLEKIVKTCSTIVSVCPPEFAKEVALSVIEAGFKGLYADVNAISPENALEISDLLEKADIDFVDGGIIGGPAWEPGTLLYLSGAKALEITECFAGGILETSIIGEKIGQASTLKMCFAAYTKGTTALLTGILATAQSLGVRENLENHWSRNGSSFSEGTHRRIQVGAQKAWRFSGEMNEIAATLESTGIPGGFHHSASEIYKRLADFKDRDPAPSVDEIINSLL